MNKASRRRSLSASRTIDSTVNFVGRIGASLRISSRKRAKEKQKLQQATSFRNTDSESWLRSGVHYAKVGVERRRSTCSAVFLGTNKNVYFADENCEEIFEGGNDEHNIEKQYQRRYQARSDSIVSSKNSRLPLYNGKDKLPLELLNFRSSKSNIDFVSAALTDEEEDLSPQYIDDYDNDNECDYFGRNAEKCADEEDDAELLSLALVPLFSSSTIAMRSSNSHSAVSSPLTIASSTGGNALTSTRSCPSTPQTPRRRYMREGATQLTSLTTLCTHHRYLFLFNDLLLVSKQKGENSYKLKEKVSLDRLWIASNNCAYSFLIGWPIHNFTAHFSSETERNEWFNKLYDCIQRRITIHPKTTTISVAVRIEGRHQLIRRDIENGVQANQIVQELISTLDLPALDQNLFHYELCFESGSFNNNINSTTSNSISNSNFGTINPNSLGHFYSNPNNSTSYTRSGSTQLSALNGVENVYAILMDHAINRIGVSLSDSQLAHLDTCPLVNCRLVLRQTTNNGSGSSGHSRSSTALHIVNQFRKVLSRTESSSKKLFGRQLEGSMPPQPVLTMIDHLTIHGAHIEGIFRKSPKQATVRVLKTQLDQGQVPDFHQFNVHVTASLLKEYLRSIPGQLLISGNYHLWIEVIDECDAEKKLKTCRQLLRLLPQSHTVLLRSILRLLRRISSAEATSKMSVSSLAVCIAPSLLNNPNIVDCARRVPDLAIYLIQNANELFDNFVDDTLLVPSMPTYLSGSVSASASTTGSDEGCVSETHQLHRSTDSGLSDDVTAGTSNNRNSAQKTSLNFSASSNSTNYGVNYDNNPDRSVSPDSALFEIPTSECSGDDERYNYQTRNNDVQRTQGSRDSEREIQIEEIDCSICPDQAILKQLCGSEVNDEEDDRTPVLSRENSDVKTQFQNRYQWRSHLSSTANGELSANDENGLRFPDLPRAGAGVRVMRLKPGSASPCTSPNMSVASNMSDRFRRSCASTASASKASPNLVSNVDDLRVSDFIISNSTSKRNAAKLDELYTPIIAFNERPSRKSSAVSMESDSRHTSLRKISTTSVESSVSQSTTSNLRRTALVTKSETLGFCSPTNRRKLSNSTTNGIEKTTVSRKPALNNFVTNANQISSVEDSEEKPAFNSSTKATSKLKRTNSTSMNACIAAAKVQQQKQQRQISAPYESSGGLSQSSFNLNNKNDQTASNLTRRPSANSNAVSWRNGAACGAEVTSNTLNGAKVVKRQSNRRSSGAVPTPTSCSTALNRMSRNATINQHRKNVGAESLPSFCPAPNRQPAHKPWRPPKRTAEEIVLDKSLEVNWSVSSIRSVFQKHKDDKPASIDTVYAKFDAINKNSTPAV